MPTLDPTLVIASTYAPNRRALIEILQARFPSVRIRVVYNMAHLMLGAGDTMDGVFVDSSTLAGRLYALQDVHGKLPVFVCDTPRWFGHGASLARGPSPFPIHSALPTLCSMFPLVPATAVLELERLLLGRAHLSPRSVGAPGHVAHVTTPEASEDTPGDSPLDDEPAGPALPSGALGLNLLAAPWPS